VREAISIYHKACVRIADNTAGMASDFIRA
jgi:hypothetical protein